MFHFLLLFGAGFVANAINSVAGGGSFVTLPILILAGVAPVPANATSTVALFPGAFASFYSYRRDIARLQNVNLSVVMSVGLFGSMVGSLLLLRTPNGTFMRIAPWLLLFATVLFAFGRQISAALGHRFASNHLLLLLILFPTSVYSGYFGGGSGIILLATFTLYGMTDIHAMNGLKTLLMASLNALASAIFIFYHQVDWIPALTVMGGALTSGFVGTALIRRLPPVFVRRTVVVVGVVTTIYFFSRAGH